MIGLAVHNIDAGTAGERGLPLVVLGDGGEWPASVDANMDVLLFGEPSSIRRMVIRRLQDGHAGRLVVVQRFSALALGDRSMGPAHLGRITVTPADLAIGLTPLRLFRMVRSAVYRGLDWRPWVDAIHFYRASLWMRWTPRERRQVQRHLEALFRLHFERWPEVHLDLLTDALDEDQVDVVAGRVMRLEPDANGVIVTVALSRGERKLRVNAVLCVPDDPPYDE